MRKAATSRHAYPKAARFHPGDDFSTSTGSQDHARALARHLPGVEPAHSGSIALPAVGSVLQIVV
jgi:hypothetical protein